jgi:hypothetical protein
MDVFKKLVKLKLNFVTQSLKCAADDTIVL